MNDQLSLSISKALGPMLPVLACLFALFVGVHLVAWAIRYVRRLREDASLASWKASAQRAEAEGVPYTFADNPDQIDARVQRRRQQLRGEESQR